MSFLRFLVMSDFVTSLHASFGQKVATVIKHVKGALFDGNEKEYVEDGK